MLNGTAPDTGAGQQNDCDIRFDEKDLKQFSYKKSRFVLLKKLPKAQNPD